MKAVPASGVPMAPASIAWRAVWCEPPRKVSGAQPTRSPLARAASTRLHSVRQGDGERLFRIDMLARGDRPETHRHVVLRRRQVEDDRDARVGEQRIDRQRLDAVGRGLGPRRVHVDVGAGDDLQDREFRGGLQIGIRDIAGADDADADGLHCRGLLSHWTCSRALCRCRAASAPPRRAPRAGRRACGRSAPSPRNAPGNCCVRRRR